MTLGIEESIRELSLTGIGAAVDAGAGAGLLRIYDGTRPATGGAATTLLSELVMSDPSFQAATGGTITANAISDDVAADATGTASWWRLVDSDGTFVTDGSVGTVGSGEDLELNTLSIVLGVNVSVSSLVLTAGNA